MNTGQLVKTLRSIGNSVSYQLGDDNPENQAADLIEALLECFDDYRNTVKFAAGTGIEVWALRDALERIERVQQLISEDG
jgi:hypothetical protein